MQIYKLSEFSESFIKIQKCSRGIQTIQWVRIGTAHGSPNVIPRRHVIDNISNKLQQCLSIQCKFPFRFLYTCNQIHLGNTLIRAINTVTPYFEVTFNFKYRFLKLVFTQY